MQPLFNMKRTIIITAMVILGVAIVGVTTYILKSHPENTAFPTTSKPQQSQKAVQDFLTKKARIASLKAQLTALENILTLYPDNSETQKHAEDIRQQLKELQ